MLRDSQFRPHESAAAKFGAQVSHHTGVRNDERILPHFAKPIGRRSGAAAKVVAASSLRPMPRQV
jgi:hypothetical protein